MVKLLFEKYTWIAAGKVEDIRFNFLIPAL
jgi:hypothetical protein